MNELSLQKEFIEAVEEAGGAGRKLNNRFLVGVVDLLVKHPDHEAMVLECKFKRTGRQASHVRVDLTVPQRRFLDDFARAGMWTGVVSFVATSTEFGVALRRPHPDMVIALDDYRWVKLHDKRARKREMLHALEFFMEG